MTAELAKHQKTRIRTDTEIFFHVSVHTNENMHSVNNGNRKTVTTPRCRRCKSHHILSHRELHE